MMNARSEGPNQSRVAVHCCLAGWPIATVVERKKCYRNSRFGLQCIGIVDCCFMVRSLAIYSLIFLKIRFPQTGKTAS
jgi:hypothetical protein